MIQTQTRLFTTALMGLVFMAGAAYAQPMPQAMPGDLPPPVAELQLPGAENPSVVAVTTTTTTTTPAPTPTGPAPVAPAASSVSGGVSGGRDPCPLPKTAMEQDPDDLAKVQEDIDRFTLCVQRAQLLERLNESALKGESSTDAALGLGSGGMGGGMGGIPMPGVTPGMAPLPASAMADASGSASSTAAPSAAVAAATAAVEDAAKEDEKKAEATEDAGWKIREIFGARTDMQARLLSPEGDEVKIKAGEKLPNSKLIVTDITPTGVTVRLGKDIKPLEWSGS